MKTQEELLKEYKKYQIKSDYVVTLEELEDFIRIGLDNLKDQKAEIFKEIKENNKQKRISVIKNFFKSPINFRVYGTELYDLDNEILTKIIKFIGSTEELFKKLKLISSSENVLELIKILDFFTDYYNQEIDYYESERDALEYACKGLSYENCKYQSNEKVIIEFFDSITNKYIKKKK